MTRCSRSERPSASYGSEMLANNPVRILDRWGSVLQGKEDGYLRVCRALLARSATDFNQALEGVIAERILAFKKKPRDEGPNGELRRTEGALFMNGLALLRLAELCGLETSREYPTLPGMARVPHPSDRA